MLIIKKEENFFKERKANESMLKGHSDELTFDLNLTFTDEIYSEKKKKLGSKVSWTKSKWVYGPRLRLIFQTD